MISEEDIRAYAKKYPCTTTEAVIQTERGRRHLVNVALDIIAAERKEKAEDD